MEYGLPVLICINLYVGYQAAGTSSKSSYYGHRDNDSSTKLQTIYAV